MAVDYDLVVIGATGAGIATAKRAIASGKKVVLVQQTGEPLQDQQGLALEKTLLHLAEQSQPMDIATWIKGAIAPDDFYEPLAHLAEAGVDVIPEMGNFVWKPSTCFVTATRRLQSKHYAIATGTTWVTPPQDGFLSPTDLLNPEIWRTLPEKIVLVGHDPHCLTLAYCLAKLGKTVTLTSEKSLLPTEDPDCVQRLQTCLEVAGVTLQFGIIPDLFNQENKAVIWAKERRGLTTQLNLPPDFCQPPQMWLRVDPELRTHRSNIYGVGPVLGGYALPELAIAEATTLVNNMAQRRKMPCVYGEIPYRLFEPLPFDHIGFQGANLPADTKILSKTLMIDRVDQLQFSQDLTLKLWLDGQDQLLGATILGDRSGKLIYHCRDLIQNQKPFQTWDNLLENAGLLAEMVW
ncbi:FAD-dependent oxidoreductase [Synechococcus sp. BDU 130192]|uniref:FAD-dependent oxidoreductase n=1 Tax=Synechococcus sp. BDU 130192 TaxID=2042059 RepID=UPI000C06BAFF|nr:FAD-dependent oxidoreductase [Synechococcus sp. BDU 130192]